MSYALVSIIHVRLYHQIQGIYVLKNWDVMTTQREPLGAENGLWRVATTRSFSDIFNDQIQALSSVPKTCPQNEK